MKCPHPSCDYVFQPGAGLAKSMRKHYLARHDARPAIIKWKKWCAGSLAQAAKPVWDAMLSRATAHPDFTDDDQQ